MVIELREQIDDAALAEASDRIAGLRIERHELEAGRDDDDALVRAVSPVGDAAVHLARRLIEARALVRPPGPQRLAGAGIGRHDVAARTGGEVQHAVHHDRRRLGVERLGRRAEVVEPPGPGDLQVLDVVAGDLIERRVARAAFDGAVGPPFHRLGTGRRAGRGRAALALEGERPGERPPPRGPMNARRRRGRSMRAPGAQDRSRAALGPADFPN